MAETFLEDLLKLISVITPVSILFYFIVRLTVKNELGNFWERLEKPDGFRRVDLCDFKMSSMEGKISQIREDFESFNSYTHERLQEIANAAQIKLNQRNGK